MTQLPESESFVLLRLSERRFAARRRRYRRIGRAQSSLSLSRIRRRKSKVSSFAAAALFL